MPCVYSRHPSSAACAPAPSGCRLRRFVAVRGDRRGTRKIHCFSSPFSRADPPFFRSELVCVPGFWRKQKKNEKIPYSTANICKFLPPKCWYAFQRCEFFLITNKIRRWHAFQRFAHIQCFSSLILGTFSDFCSLRLIFCQVCVGMPSTLSIRAIIFRTVPDPP